MTKDIKKINTESNIKQSNRLVEAKYKLTLNEQRLVVAICSQLDYSKDNIVTVRIKVSDIADFCKITGTDKYTKIRRIIMRLLDRKLLIHKSNGGWYATHWLQSAEYFPDESVIEYKIDERLKPELLNLRKAYLDTPAAPLMEFKSDYSVRLYLILKKMLKVRDFTYNLDFFRETFQLSKSYTRISNLKNRVLLPALEEINKISDISVMYDFIREGKTYTKIRFVIKSKVNIKKSSPKITLKQIVDSDFFGIRSWGISQQTEQKLVSVIGGSDELQEYINFVRNSKNIENKAAYLVKAVLVRILDERKEATIHQQQENAAEIERKRKVAEEREKIQLEALIKTLF